MPAFRHGGIVYRVHSYSGDMSVQCIVMSAYRNNETMAERVLELLEGGSFLEHCAVTALPEERLGSGNGCHS